MIDEDLQKFSESRVMRTIAIGRVPIRNLPNSPAKAHCSSELADNCMNSSEESSGTENISDQPGPSSNITQTSLEENINAQIGLGRKSVIDGKGRPWKEMFLTPKLMAVLTHVTLIREMPFLFWKPWLSL
ncbi:hypothetical protein AVEN_121068-1 [Araneus ventricosus]|uniref:Uncharacterized protein n=1 Tax=Araneus ventricosus TaxID=182803 RepID=A0A4Y2X1M7_ARAVE|nr:hypothetical protein AVEN_121068-1 [Araneus ventricosus]